MATGKKYYWIKLKDSFMTSDKVDYLMSQPSGANYVVLYQMLCLKTINTNGVLARSIGEIIIPFDIPKIQRDCKYFSEDTIRVALELYKGLGMIYTQDDGMLKIEDFNDLVGSETDYAKQKRLQREKTEVLSLEDTKVDTNVDNVHTDIRDKRLENRDKILDKDIKDKGKAKTTTKRFVKPSIEELEAYCNEKGYKIDCTYFWNYYESKGWLIGKSPMKSWKATLSNWERRGDFNHKPTPKKQPKPDWYDDYKNDIEDKYDYQIDEDGVEIFGGGMLDD